METDLSALSAENVLSLSAEAGVTCVVFASRREAVYRIREWEKSGLAIPEDMSAVVLQTDKEDLSEDEIMSEFVIMGLRLNKGVSATEFYKRFSLQLWEAYGEVIAKHEKNGLLTRLSDGGIVLTKEGRNLSNFVMADFLE